MYILILSRGYPTEQNKILGIFEMDQAKALKKLGCKIVFLSTDLRSIRRKRKWGYERKTIDGIEIYGMNIPLGRISRNILNKVSFFAVSYLYKKAIRDNGEPDILHAHFTHQGYLGSRLKKKYNIPLVVTEHSYHINKEDIKGELLKKAKIAYKQADQLVAVSPSLQKRIKGKFGMDSIYIPNIVDTDIFSYKPKTKEKTFKFVSTGHLIPIKGNAITIEAFYRVFKDNPDVELKIFGEGNERKDLENMIYKLGLTNKVILMGQCNREEIALEYGRSDAFILASKSETFGVAYIEALASGLPIIGTRCGGPETFIDDENGVLSDVDDLDGLVKNIKHMYNNIDKYDRKSISEHTREKFSPESVGEKIINVYKDIL